ncbi:MAG TPA: serine hydrolase [Candidatus Binatia bacterium]|nr:serine hydrolase [Candidatus Binatia bacterium]
MRAVLNMALLSCLLAGLLAAGIPKTAGDVKTRAARLDPALRGRAFERARELPRLRSLLVSIDGELVEERYFNGARTTDPANLKSASKSVLSALVGIAFQRGYLKSLDESIGKFFPEYLAGVDGAKKQNITIGDLLTMRSGLESTSNVNYGRWVQSNNWVRFALSRPLVDEPGGRMIYSTGNSHLLSALLTKAAKMSTFEFARRYLAEPLGVPMPPWVRDPQGIYLGGNEMHWTPRGMLAFGELYLNGGRMGDKQVVPESWVKESIKPRTTSRWSGREYGYGWWIDRLAGHETYYAWGHGGQFIFVVPALKMVVVTTSVPSPGEGRREHQHAIYNLLEQDLIPAADPRRFALRSPQGQHFVAPLIDLFSSAIQIR